MNLTVIGTGYVGLVTGACFAEMGNTVTCVDIDALKIENLQKGILPIYEPGLDSIVVSNHKAGRLHFSTSLAEAMKGAEVLFIAVGTPPGEDGSADLKYVLGVAKEIGQNLESYAVIVDKSTVPVGTSDKVRAQIQTELQIRNKDCAFDVVSNPEFLKEGAAVNDFMSPDRIIIGSDSVLAVEKMKQLYGPFNRSNPRTIFMGIRDAEMTKYAANAMLATKISFINEISNLCDRLDVDVENVRLGIGSDERIGFHFIYPGMGYGGSCFPKDVKALVETAKQLDFDATLLKAVEYRNEVQKNILFQKISSYFGESLAGKRFAIWGLSFKPGTDDMREAPSKVLIASLLAAGAKLNVFDPVANDVARQELSEECGIDGISFCDDQNATLSDVDALIIATEWKIFRNPDFAQLKIKLKDAVIFDGRNIYDPSVLAEHGIKYISIGRSNKVASN